ncbi:MAG: hypothetical protein ISQ53_05105 [Synechococcus sp. BS307-5m-G39]|nr:hypothetical protein [Synechococcus sp. BS307-5m-G39]MBL6800836.1 hypothetical protein [Synechococcus sp. BS307-5m-G37]
MKQLPGRGRPKWIQQLAALGAAVVATIWLVTLLPVLLFVGLIAGLLLIPVLRQLRLEVEQLERRQRGEPSLPRDVTPWHRRIWNQWRGL